MSHKVKRQNSSMASSFERWVNKISNIRLSASTITTIVIAYAIFLFGGGLFTIIVPIFPPYINNNFLFIYPELASQFISDTIIAATLYVMGFVGLLALYQSTKYAYKPRQAYMTAIAGVALLLMAYIFLEGILAIKIA